MPWKPLKLHYLFVYALLGAILPYLPIYLEEAGLGDARIGWIVSLFGVAVLVSPQAATWCADRWLGSRVLIAACYAGAGLALAGLVLARGFAAMAVTYGLFCLAFTAMIPLMDGLTFARLERARAGSGREGGGEGGGGDAGAAPKSFHTIRIWGSIGFMIPAVLLFFLLERGGVGAVAAIVLAAGIAGAGLLAVRGLPAERPAPGASWPTGEAWRMLTRPAVGALVGSVAVMSMSISIFYAFYPGYLRELGVPSSWVGLVVSLGVIAEIGCMLVFRRLLERLGVRRLMVGAAAATALRLGLLVMLPVPAVAIATQLLHGPFVLGLYVIPQLYLDRCASDRFRHSVQGVYAFLVFGAARLAGSPAGGHVAEAAAGGERLFGLRMALLLGAGLALVAAAWLWAGFRDPGTCRELEARP